MHQTDNKQIWNVEYKFLQAPIDAALFLSKVLLKQPFLTKHQMYQPFSEKFHMHDLEVSTFFHITRTYPQAWKGVGSTPLSFYPQARREGQIYTPFIHITYPQENWIRKNWRKKSAIKLFLIPMFILNFLILILKLFLSVLYQNYT